MRTIERVHRFHHFTVIRCIVNVKWNMKNKIIHIIRCANTHGLEFVNDNN